MIWGLRAFCAALCVFALALLAFPSASSVQAAQADVVISELDCDSDPELVVLTNEGNEPVDLAGWRLESDPPGQEAFGLTAVRALGVRQSVTIQSGPTAQGALVWSTREVFRNGDATDYARLVDADGQTLQEVTCATGAPVSPSPAPVALGESSSIPDGGGPPGTDASSLVLILTFALGGMMLISGSSLMLVSNPWPRTARSLGAVPTTDHAPLGERQQTTSRFATVILIGVAAIVLLAIGARGREREDKA